ncbi:MAG: PTS sugar transporter subunit IIC [Lachnospiraceae bacterium]|jgi:PTS system mannose-specific IIC component|nr:PTS sugar transporter subunit IIC [Lachnospiraceae bacterium]
MSVLQAFLCGCVYFLGSSPLVFGVSYYTVYRPIVSGLLVGLILGDPVTGIVVGATIQLIYLGVMSTGGSMPSDQSLAGVLGTALAIAGGLSTEEALAIAVPIGLLGTLVYQGKMAANVVFVHMLDNCVEKGDTRHVWIYHVLLPMLFLFCITAIPCALAAYFGADYVGTALEALGGRVLNIVRAVGGMLPAVGIALSLRAIFKGEARVFFFVGFLLSVYFELSMLAIGMLAICAAIIYMQLKPQTEGVEEND